MKSLYNKKGHRRGDGEGHQFAFFAVGAVVILAAVFLIGLQVGRVVERGQGSAAARGEKDAQPAGAPGSPSTVSGSDIRKDLGAYSEEAVKVPVVPPPDAKTAVREVEKSVTFRETLSNKEPTTVPLVRPGTTAARSPAARDAQASGARKYVVQAGAFRDKGAAEKRRKRLAKAGFAVRTVPARKKSGEPYYRVIVGPFPDAVAAKKAMRAIEERLKIDAFLAPG